MSEDPFTEREYISAWQENVERMYPKVLSASKSVYRMMHHPAGGEYYLSNMCALNANVAATTAHGLSHTYEDTHTISDTVLIPKEPHLPLLSLPTKPLFYGDPGSKIFFPGSLKPNDFSLLGFSSLFHDSSFHGRYREVNTGDSVFAVGYCSLGDETARLYIDPLIIPGKVLGTENHLIYVERTVKADFSGLSGSALVDKEGEFVGMVFSQWPGANLFVVVDGYTIFNTLEGLSR